MILFRKLLKYYEIKFLDNLNEGKSKFVKEFYPSAFYTNHTIKKNKLKLFLSVFKNSFSLIFGISYYKYYCKGNNKFAIYVPNSKYNKFYNRIQYYFSCTITDNNKIFLNNIYNFNILSNIVFIVSLYISFMQFKKKDIFILSKLLLSANSLRSICSFCDNKEIQKVLSFAPISLLNSAIFMYLEIDLVSIRPQSTPDSIERQYIKTNKLYFKSVQEKKVYENRGVKTKLQKGGYIYENQTYSKNSFEIQKAVILFIDTCENRDPESKFVRRRAINKFYSNIDNNNIIYHKFHPGLDIREKERTKIYFNKKNVKIVEDIDFRNSYIVIGFYSTLLYELIMYRNPVAIISGRYSVSNEDNDITKSCNFLTINDENDFKMINSKIKIMDSNYSIKTYKWFKSEYNIPFGKKDLLSEFT